MGIIIPESQYHFLKPECRALDLEVDKLTSMFDADEGLRGVMVEHYHWEKPTRSWKETSMASIPGRMTQGLLLFVDVGREQVAQYTLPTIVLPSEMDEYARRMELRERWECDLSLQNKVDNFEKALLVAYREFCKQTMNHLLANIAGEPLLSLHSDRYQAVHKSIEKFSPEMFSGCDNAYYMAGKRKMAEAATHAEELKKDDLGALFVMTPDDMGAYMRQQY